MSDRNRIRATAEADRTKSHSPVRGEAQKPPGTQPNPIVGLQQKAGNQAMLGLLASGKIQAKLRVSQPGDAEELEADRVADRVVSSPEQPAIHRKCKCEGGGASCPACEEDEVEQAKGIHRKDSGVSDGGLSVGNGFAQSLGSGSPLEASVRKSMEANIGHDFSHVRVHTDDRAASSARSINAQAYALGNNVVFDRGAYAPHSSQGKRLLAHELAHVAQGAGKSTAVARQPAADVSQEARSYIAEAIDTLDAQADIFRVDVRSKTATFDDAQFRVRLTRLKNILDKAQSIIDSNLAKDPSLTRSLQASYKRAIDAAIAFAANRQKQTSHAEFESFVDLIADWALPQAVTEKSEAELSGALPAGVRTSLTEITTNVQIDVESLFSTKVATTTVSLPPHVNVEFSSGVPAKLQHGLSNVAGTVIPDPLHLNSTITLALDLEPFGGDYALYRFTFLERRVGRGKTEHVVLIERLGAMGVERMTQAQSVGAQKKFDAHGFARGSGWSDPEFEQVLEAIAQLPDSQLSPVDGITFRRDREDPKDPKTAGNYSPDSHSITMFDRAFRASATRFGVPGKGVSNFAVDAVAHEVGHAVDLLPLRTAWSNYEKAGNVRKDAFAEFEDPPGSGNYSFPSNKQATWNALSARVAAAERSLTATRADSGERYQKDRTGTYEMVEGGKAAGAIEFRQAAAADGGKRITAYSDKEWQEFFAESFSLYTTDPETLQRLRPHVFQFLVRHHPK